MSILLELAEELMMTLFLLFYIVVLTLVLDRLKEHISGRTIHQTETYPQYRLMCISL